MNRRHHRTLVLLLIAFCGSVALIVWRVGQAVGSAPMPLTVAQLGLPDPAIMAKPVPPMSAIRFQPGLTMLSSLQIEDQTVRVRLWAEGSPIQMTVEAEKGIWLGRHHLDGRVTVTAQGRDLWVRAGGQRKWVATHVRVRSVNDSPLLLESAHLPTRRTLGDLQLSVENKRLKIVNTLPMEAYVQGVVEPELGSVQLPVEAMKAQLIASRSYILAMRDRHPGENYDFCDSPHCQVYAGIGHTSPAFRRAVSEAQGWILTYHGHPAAAFFHHNCGGTTAAIEDVWPGPAIPYLRRVKDGTPSYCAKYSFSRWTFRAKKSMLKKCFVEQKWLKPTDAIDSIHVIKNVDGIRARNVVIQGNSTQWVLADKFRRVINKAYGSEVLLSANYDITVEGDKVRFDGRGWGHGVGMCQSGAIEMARQHRRCDQILAHYYPGTKLEKLRDMPAPARHSDPAFRKYLAFWTN